MTQKTMDRLVDFIKDYKDIRHLSVAWYGGEPLLAFDTICTLTGQFRNLGLTYEKAGLVNNGYLLDDEKINKLNDLMIASIQITLDGPREVHHTRRVLANGGPTFDRKELHSRLLGIFRQSCVMWTVSKKIWPFLISS